MLALPNHQWYSGCLIVNGYPLRNGAPLIHFLEEDLEQKMKLIASVCILVAALFVVPIKGEEPLNVTMVQLIANPEKFDGKLIRVIGYLRLEFEGDVLYLHREDYEFGILGDGVWIDVTPEMTTESKSLNLHYVLLEGIFSSRDRGHMGMWSGAVKKIRRSELWRSQRQRE
jgi:hypothetical protein